MNSAQARRAALVGWMATAVILISVTGATGMALFIIGLAWLLISAEPGESLLPQSLWGRVAVAVLALAGLAGLVWWYY